jgi:hypothetical protein
MPCTSERVRYFGRTYRLDLQGRKVIQLRNQQEQEQAQEQAQEREQVKQTAEFRWFLGSFTLRF